MFRLSFDAAIALTVIAATFFAVLHLAPVVAGQSAQSRDAIACKMAELEPTDMWVERCLGRPFMGE